MGFIFSPETGFVHCLTDCLYRNHLFFMFSQKYTASHLRIKAKIKMCFKAVSKCYVITFSSCSWSLTCYLGTFMVSNTALGNILPIVLLSERHLYKPKLEKAKC